MVCQTNSTLAFLQQLFVATTMQPYEDVYVANATSCNIHVKLSNIHVKLSNIHVKLSNIHVKLSNIHVKLQATSMSN